jgi:hypothetical protein
MFASRPQSMLYSSCGPGGARKNRASMAMMTPPGSATDVAPFAKIYSGELVNGWEEVTVRSDTSVSPLFCLDFFTPMFGWGYHGGAPEELAIAILHDYFGSARVAVGQRVLRLYRPFADEVVAKFARGHRWSLPSGLVERWIARHEALPTVA